MANRRRLPRGVVILETALALISVLAVLLGAWGAVDLYQQGVTLEEVVERAFYDGVAPGYRFDSTGNGSGISVDYQHVLTFIQKQVAGAADELRAQGTLEHRFGVQGGLAEIRWSVGGTPHIERITVTSPVGGNTAITKTANFQSSVDDFLRRLTRENVSRTRFIRPDLWNDGGDDGSSLGSSILLIGFSAALSVDQGMASYLMKSAGREPVIVRNSFNVLRRDL